MIVETVQEIDNVTYNKLLNNYDRLQKFGKELAKSSFFKPNMYGYYGCELFHDVSNDKYYISWKRNKEPFNKERLKYEDY